MEKRTYPKFTIAAGGFAETPEGKALYARCQKDGDMAPYKAAKAAYAEACREMLPPPVDVPVLPGACAQEGRKRSMEEDLKKLQIVLRAALSKMTYNEKILLLRIMESLPKEGSKRARRE